MIKHLEVASINVSDQDRALDFYVNKLGFRLHVDMQLPNGLRWIQVLPQEGQASFSLEPGGGPADKEKGQHSGYILNSDDVQADYEALQARGVEFVQAPNFQGWGTYSEFRDPDGNIFGLATATNVQQD